jgi:hypothetical protein
MDLLETTEDGDDDLNDDLNTKPKARQESAWGPLEWNTRLSVELQNVVDQYCIEELCSLSFSVTIADPQQPDCPLVACSTGFTELTGYTVQEIIGKNCRFLLNGVPPNLIDEGTRMKCRAFCLSCAKGDDYIDETDSLPAGTCPWSQDGDAALEKPWVQLPKGELICVQTNARKTCELFRNMFYLKQVECDDTTLILGLQAGIPEECDQNRNISIAEIQKRYNLAFNRLEENMAALEQVLASEFWYSAPMRRQV